MKNTIPTLFIIVAILYGGKSDPKPSPQAPISVNNDTEIIPDASTVVPENPTTSNTTTTTEIPTSSIIPSTTPNTAPTVIPTSSTTTVAPNSTTTITPTSAPPTKSPPTSPPTKAPHKDRHFDGPSFIGGIILATGLMAIGFVAFKFYKARTERNYHTL